MFCMGGGTPLMHYFSSSTLTGLTSTYTRPSMKFDFVTAAPCTGLFLVRWGVRWPRSDRGIIPMTPLCRRLRLPRLSKYRWGLRFQGTCRLAHWITRMPRCQVPVPPRYLIRALKRPSRLHQRLSLTGPAHSMPRRCQLCRERRCRHWALLWRIYMGHTSWHKMLMVWSWSMRTRHMSASPTSV